jgi:SPP1 gp7 family putative phage head morphogenesis protein
MEQKLETDFFDRYGLSYIKGFFDRSLIPELQDDIETARQQDREDIKTGVLTINEVREKRDLAPVEWGDTAWFPLGLTPAGTRPVIETGERAATAIAFLEEKRTPIAFISKRKPAYTTLFKDFVWKQIIKTWEEIEREYTEELIRWFFEQRSFILETVASDELSDLIAETIDDGGYWGQQTADLRQRSRPFFTASVVASERHIRSILGEIGFDIQPNWSIFDTTAVQKLDDRLLQLQGVTDTMRKQVNGTLQDAIKDGKTNVEAAEGIRERYGIAKNRSKTIARTEIGNVLNDSRISAYDSLGFEKHEWLDSRDAKVRDEHRIDGEVAVIGERFSNGMLWPYDESVSDPGLIINCRCLTVPITED